MSVSPPLPYAQAIQPVLNQLFEELPPGLDTYEARATLIAERILLTPDTGLPKGFDGLLGLGRFQASVIDDGDDVSDDESVSDVEDVDDVEEVVAPPPPMTLDELKARLDNLSETAATGEYASYYNVGTTIHRSVLSLLLDRSFIIQGAHGRGKRHLLHRLVHELSTGNLPASISGKTVLSLDLQTVFNEENWVESLKRILEECGRYKDEILLVIPEMNLLTYRGTMNAEEAMGAIREQMDAGLQVMGTYSCMSWHPHPDRYFDQEGPADLVKVSNEDYLSMVQKLANRKEREVINQVVDLLEEKFKELPITHGVTLDKKAAEAAVDFAKSGLDFEEMDVNEVLKDASSWVERCIAEMYFQKSQDPSFGSSIDRKVMYQVYSIFTGTPIEKVGSAQKGLSLTDPLSLADRLRQRVVGQDMAIEAVSDAIITAVAGFNNPDQPIGTFLFLGPTGVGKTELAKTVAEELFGSEQELVRLDMSEYQESHRVSLLIGAPPGYVGYYEGGKLTEAVKEKPHSVVLLDEIEKAHPDVLKIFLQVFDDGRLTDGQGETIDFRNCLFILTSNLLSQEIGRMATEGMDQTDILAAIKQYLMNRLTPELYNRFQGVVPFNPISDEIVAQVVPIMLSQIKMMIKDRKDMELTWDSDLVTWLGKKGYDPDLGLRPLKRLVHEKIPQILSKAFIRGDISEGDSVRIYIDQDELQVRPVSG